MTVKKGKTRLTVTIDNKDYLFIFAVARLMGVSKSKAITAIIRAAAEDKDTQRLQKSMEDLKI